MQNLGFIFVNNASNCYCIEVKLLQEICLFSIYHDFCLFGPWMKRGKDFSTLKSSRRMYYFFQMVYFSNYTWMRWVMCKCERRLVANEASACRWCAQMRQLFWDNAICLLCCWFNEASRSASALSNWTLEAGDARGEFADLRWRIQIRPPPPQQKSVVPLSGGVNNCAVKAQH